jgi:hypothetical protein
MTHHFVETQQILLKPKHSNMQIKMYEMPKIQTKLQTQNNKSYTAQLAEEVFYWVPVCRVQHHLYKLGLKSPLVDRVNPHAWTLPFDPDQNL